MTIKSMKPALEDLDIPEQKYPNILFSLDAPDLEVFAKLPSGVQEMIKKSPEWKALPFSVNWETENMKRQLAKLKDKKSTQPSF